MNIPDYCYALNNMTIDPKTKIGEVIKIQALEKGYYPTNIKETQEFVDNYNMDMLGVTKAQSEAMKAASMFGWECYKNVLEFSAKRLEKSDTVSTN